MILVAGGSGTLGTKVVRLLRQRGLQVRVLTRDRKRASHLIDAGVEVVEGTSATLLRFSWPSKGRGAWSPQSTASQARRASPASVDRDGNHNLIRAARKAGVEHLVLVSVLDASPDHPMDLMRMKYAAEEELKASGLAWTILRPAAYMELWCELLGRPLLEKGKTQVFGRGRNPINWVSASDVARFVEVAIADPALRGQTIEVGGPENLSVTEFLDVLRSGTAANGKVGHVPLAGMRVGAIVMRLVNPSMARLIQGAIVMDTRPQAFDASETRRRYPSIPITSLAEVVQRDFVESPGAARSSRGGS